jgi:hypothetical protein
MVNKKTVEIGYALLHFHACEGCIHLTPLEADDNSYNHCLEKMYIKTEEGREDFEDIIWCDNYETKNDKDDSILD